jgi:hypothetical protein
MAIAERLAQLRAVAAAQHSGSAPSSAAMVVIMIGGSAAGRLRRSPRRRAVPLAHRLDARSRPSGCAFFFTRPMRRKTPIRAMTVNSARKAMSA